MKKLLLLYLLILSACASTPKQTPLHKFSGIEMEVPYRILVGDSNIPFNQEQLSQIIHTVFNEIDTIYNRWNPESELSKFNQASAHLPIHLSKKLYSFLQKTDSVVKLTEGRFDPTVKPLQTLWKKKLQQGNIPSEKEINQLISSIGWHHIKLENGMAVKTHPLTEIDLDGIVKGYCVDLLLEHLQKAGYPNLYVDWGGEIRTSGQHPESRTWNIFIRGLSSNDPEKAAAHISLREEAIATSGNYLQYWIIDNGSQQRDLYTHIMNPITKKPLKITPNSISSATVIAPECWFADAIATSLMLFPSIEEALIWMETFFLEYPQCKLYLLSNQAKEQATIPSA